VRRPRDGWGYPVARRQPAELARWEPDLPPTIAKRARHIVTEDARVLQAVQAMRAGDLARLGKLMNASHESLKNDYESACENWIPSPRLRAGSLDAWGHGLPARALGGVR